MNSRDSEVVLRQDGREVVRVTGEIGYPGRDDFTQVKFKLGIYQDNQLSSVAALYDDLQVVEGGPETPPR